MMNKEMMKAMKGMKNMDEMMGELLTGMAQTLGKTSVNLLF